jgi:hypothetical protein
LPRPAALPRPLAQRWTCGARTRFRYLLREVPYRSSDTTHGLSLVLGRQPPTSSDVGHSAFELLRSFRALGRLPSSGGAPPVFGHHPRAVACPRTPAAAFERVRSSRAVGRSSDTTHGLSLVLGRQPPLSSVFVALELSDDLRLYPLRGVPGPRGGALQACRAVKHF